MRLMRRSETMNTILTVALVYVVGIVVGGALALGVDAMGHFIMWTPYREFPWQMVRMGMVGGILVVTMLIGASIAA